MTVARGVRIASPLKLDKATIVQRYLPPKFCIIAAPVAGKGYAMVESVIVRCGGRRLDAGTRSELTIPVDKTRTATILISVRWWCVPAINPFRDAKTRRVGLHLPLG